MDDLTNSLLVKSYHYRPRELPVKARVRVAELGYCCRKLMPNYLILARIRSAVGGKYLFRILPSRQSKRQPQDPSFLRI
jgi:hypothetical protein